jgi:hypothetical protein
MTATEREEQMSTVTDKLHVDDITSRLEAARSRGADWIVSRIGDDGEPPGAGRVNHYYRLPWALAVAGRVDVAARVVSWVERHALTPEGDLRAGPPRQNWNGVGWTHDAASYPLAILATGMWHLERYDTAGAIMTTLRAFQDDETGGGYVERPECRDTGRHDLLCTAQLGLAALTTGRLDMADAAFAWLERLWAEQPALPDRLYLSTTKDGLATDPPAGQEFAYYMEIDKPRQAFFNPGIGAAFAARYLLATGNAAAREIGRGLLDFSERASDTQYDFTDTVHVGKFGWGAGAMLDVEPADSYFADVLRMGQWYLDSQLEDGRWNPTAFLVPEPDDADALWKTAEHIVLMTVVEMALASRPRTVFGK